MQRETWKYTSKNIFSLWSNLMVIYGIWPLSEDTPFLRGRIMFAIVQMILSITAALMKFYVQCGSADDTIDTILMIVISIMIIGKCCLLYVHRDDLGYVINAAVEDWNLIENKKYKRMMFKRANFSNIVTKIFYAMGTFCLSSYIIQVLVFHKNYVIDKNSENGSLILQPPYVLPGGCVFNSMGNLLYYLVLINQTIQLSVSCPINLGGDAFYIAITAHLCEQCEILKLELKKFGRNHSSIEKSHRHLRNLIARHQHLMILAMKLEAVYNEIIFMQMFMSVVLISVTGFSFLCSLNAGDIAGVTKCFGVVQFMLLQSYFYTFPADELKDQAEGLLRAFYSSQWYNMPSYIMKDIVFVMMRMNLPPYYTAGKIFYMTRESYMTVIKTAASYLSVLRIMIK